MPPRQPVITIRELASPEARAYRRACRIDIFDDGQAVLDEVPPKGMIVAPRPPRQAISDAPSVIGGALREAGFARWPVQIGEGPQWIELTFGGHVATVHFVAEDTYVTFDAAASRAETVAPIRLVLAFLSWFFAGAHDASPSPWAAASSMFPSEDVLRHRRRALRFSDTHDWDGARAYHRVHELRMDDTGRCERFVLGTDGGVIETRPLGDNAAEDIFSRLDRLAFRSFVGGSNLDRTYTQRLTYFDGNRVRTMTHEFGSERGIGTSPDECTRDEREVLDRLIALLGF